MSFQHTPLDEIPHIVEELTLTFKSGKVQPIQYRLNQLRNLYFAIEDNVEPLCEALQKDFNRSAFETRMFEYHIFKSEIIEVMSNLSSWLKPERPSNVPLAHMSATMRIEKIPRGVVLIISPFNYPLMLSLSPLVGAIASGNCVVFKQSELIPHFSYLLSDILTKALDSDIFRPVNGGVEETTVLLRQKYDFIFFTGSPRVGKIVAKAAAENLTPVVLELGGKSPAIVTKNHGNLDIIANRILWGKTVNAGQTCVAIDYVLCEESVKLELISKLKSKLENQFFPGLSVDTDYTHLVSDNAFKTLKNIVDTTNGDIVAGDLSLLDAKSRFFPPMIISNVSWDDSTMQNELFCPILPIISYKDLSKELDNVVKYHDCPLALYIYSNDNKSVELIKSKVRSGGISINDNVTHVGVGALPFGGIGTSGYGNYHGKYSINAFSHQRAVFKQPLFLEFVMKLRYPPFTRLKEKLLKMALDSRPFFKRDKDVPVGSKWWLYLVGLFMAFLSYFYLS